MYTLMLLILVSTSAVLAADNEGDLDSLIAQIFGVKNNTEAPRVTRSAAEASTREPTKKNPEENLDCVTRNGEKGTCVAYYKCVTNIEKEDGAGIIDIAGGLGMENCPSYLDVCCTPNNTQ